MFDKLSNVWAHVAAFGQDRRGAIAVIVALLLPILAGVLALAIDLSRAANLQTELQDHADAAALAGATQLDQSDGARARAIQAAAGALALAINTQRFGDDTETSGEGGIAIDPTVNVPANGVAVNNDIRFFVDLADKVEATTDAEANFIEINIQPREISYFFAGLVSQITEAYPQARAVAGYDQLICGIQPMMICNPNGGGSFNVFGNEGRGLFLKIPEGAGGGGGGGGGGSDFIDGEFGFLEVGETKANDVVCQALGSVNPSPICLGTGLNGKPGNVTSLGECINVRFNIYDNNGMTAGWRSNLAYQPDINSVKGLIHDGSAACNYNVVAGGGGGPSAWERPDQVGQPLYEGPGSDLTGLTTMSYPRDNCAYGGYCDLNNGGTYQVGNGEWDIDSYTIVEHPTLITGSNPPGQYLVDAVVGGNYDKAPLNADAATATGNISRKEVYDWEVGSGNFPASADHDPYAPTSCWSGGTLDYVGSRRVITVAVIDCDNSPNNKKDLIEAKPHSAIDIFLTEPVGGVTPNDVYAEIVGPAGNQNLTTTATNRVVLYE